MLRLIVALLLGMTVVHAEESGKPPDGSPSPAEASPEGKPTPAAEQASPSVSPQSSPEPANAGGVPAEAGSVDPVETGQDVPLTGGQDGVEPPADGGPGLIPSELPTAPAGVELDGAPLVTEDIISLDAAQDPAMPDESFVDPNAIVPDQLLPPPPAVTELESEAERLRGESIRYREVRTRAEQAPEVVAMKERADNATTAEDQRAALREYYRLLFAKVTSMDKTLKSKAQVMQDAYVRNLAQRRLEPTIPLNPPPTPEPLN